MFSTPDRSRRSTSMETPESNRRIVAIYGQIGAGKSTMARLFEELLGYRRISFASALKEDLLNCGFTPEHIEHKPPWMRELMQAYGLARRAVDPMYWARILRDFLVEEEGCFAIDDLRFDNEVEMLEGLRSSGWNVKYVSVAHAGHEVYPPKLPESERGLTVASYHLRAPHMKAFVRSGPDGDPIDMGKAWTFVLDVHDND